MIKYLENKELTILTVINKRLMIVKECNQVKILATTE